MRARLLTLVGLSLGGCAGYRSAPLDVERPLRPGPAVASPISFDDAVRRSVASNPELAALRERADAVNLNPPREPIEIGGGVDADHRREVSASLDALSLLGFGTRPAELALAAARRSEALLAHHARAREIATEIAETFVVEQALAGLPTPDLAIDADAYVRAGLESSVAETAAAATRADWEAELAERAAEHRANRLALARLLGLPPSADVAPAAVPVDWPPRVDAAPAAMIASRPQVQRRVAAFEVADAELRRAVAAQFPSLVLEPGIALDPTSFFGAVRLRIPLGACSAVHAAEADREAARHDVEAAVLDALRDAAESRARHAATVVVVAAARRRLSASSDLFRVGKTRLEVEAGSVIEIVLAADAVLGSARALREALLAEARQRVRAARDAGWPRAGP